MNKHVIDLWAEALTTYSEDCHGYGSLTILHANTDCFYTATGVLAQLALAHNLTQCTITGWDRYGFGQPGQWHYTTLPDEVLTWAGITRDFEHKISRLCDARTPFAEIADVIRTQLHHHYAVSPEANS